MSKKRLTETEREEIVTAANAGTPYQDIAVRYGVHRATISLIATKAGVRRRAVRGSNQAADGQPEPEASSDE